MISGAVLLLVSLLYVGALFALAYWGDRRPLYPNRAWLRPLVYGLALAVYCSSWTFYGAVGSAASSSLSYLPIYLGPILLFVLGAGLLRRLTLVAKQRNITSIADFVAARFGKSQRLAALVTVIAITASVPYLALQFKAVAMSINVLGGTAATRLPFLDDSALYIAVLLALFAILFGTRQIDATEHHHGMMLAIAAESLVKLVAFIVIGVYALSLQGLGDTLAAPVHELVTQGLPPGFITQTLLAYVAIFCLPRQFQVGVVECEDPADVGRARVLFPLYLLLISAFVLPIVAATAPLAAGQDVRPDSYLLWLPLAHHHHGLALLAYVGGFSAATGMVIVETVALSIMISNDLVMPALLRVRAFGLEQRADLSSFVLTVRRVAIVVLAALAYAYYHATAQSVNLASIGLLAFVALAQFAPAIVSGLYWRGASRIGVGTALIVGFTVWAYTLLLPSIAQAGWISAQWVDNGPLGISWLRPHALFNLQGWDAVTHGTFWSLLANVGCLIFLSLRFRPGIDERLRASGFLDPYADKLAAAGEWRGRIHVADLRALAGRIIGERGTDKAFEDYATGMGRRLQDMQLADRPLLQFTERLLAGAIGAASARRMLTSALRGTGLDLSEAALLLDETSQQLRFNRELLGVTFENMTQAISVVDADLRIVAWNRRYAELFAYPDGFVYVGRPVADLIRYNVQHGLIGGDVEELVQRRLRHLRSASRHVFARELPDGRVIETHGEPLPGGGYLTTFTDITAHKQAERALLEANETLEQRVAQRTHELRDALRAQEQAKQEAEAAHTSKTRFFAAASHDLLQPLNAARLFTSALRQQPQLDSDVAALAERIDTSFKAAEDLLDALLEVSRLDAGRYQPDISTFALSQIIEPMRDQFSVIAATRGLQLRVVPTRLVVRSDAQLLRRIVQNFVSNALRYTRQGGVLLGVRRYGGEASVEVWDSGPGISAEHLQMIFNEFQRLDRPSPWGEKGLGLGLAICERMARILGHELSAESWPGSGSRFAIRVPIEIATTLGAARARAPRTQADSLPSNLHVLCLDNDGAILDGMSALLTRWNVRSHGARTIDEARAAMARRSPDLILADYHLDEASDGLAALDVLCAAGIPGALITADASADLKQQARQRGYPMLQKPLKPAALRALIAHLTRGIEATV